MRLVLAFVVLALVQIAATAFALAQNIDDRRYVCMMQDSVQVKPGTPIDIDGNTFFGCCPMCAGKMKADTKAKDLVSVTVDKSKAFIFELSGTAYYFESAKS